MKFSNALARLAVAGSLAACSNPNAVEKDGVRVVVEALALRVINETDEARAVAAFDASVLPLILWGQCASPEPACLRLAAHGTLRIPFTEIGGDGGDIVVYTWTIVRASDGSYRATEPTTIAVKR